jgi:uncharacterized protein GlcG (DUF336 family)
MSSITLEEADRAVEASLAKARELGMNMAVAVVDTETSLVALSRMDGTNAFTPDVVRGKAVAVVITRGTASGVSAARFPAELRDAVSGFYGGRVTWVQGGVAIKRNGEVIGAVAAGGGPPDQDELVAQAGADVIS